MQPKYACHFANAEFLGHFFDCDVYMVHAAGDACPSITAQHSDEEGDYGSSRLDIFAQSLDNDIGGIGMPTMPMRTFIFSRYNTMPHLKAWVMALMMRGIKIYLVPAWTTEEILAREG